VDRCANNSGAAPRREFFAKFCCRGEVSGTLKSHSSTTQVPLSSRRETSGAWNSQSWTVNTSDLKRRLADTINKHITKTSSTTLLVKNTSFDKGKLILIILLSRCTLSWGEQCLKQPKFNNVRAIIVLREQNSWATCGSLRQRLQSCAPDVIFLPNFAAVVTWAVREKAKVQQRRCHYLPIVRYMWCVKQPNRHSSTIHSPLLSYESKTAGRLVDRCANDSRAAPPTWFFAKFCCRGDVSGTWKSQSSTTQVPLSSHREVYVVCETQKLNTEHQLLEVPQTVKVQQRTCHY